MVVLCTVGSVYAQQDIVVSYDKQDVQIITGELVSNVLRIVNNSSREQQVKVTIDFPQEWKQIGSAVQIRSVLPGDSVFVPVRLMTQDLVGGNNKFMINANVLSMDDKVLAEATFWAFTKKQTSWAVNSPDGNKIYFRNGENEVDFHINVLNTGGENQKITMTLNNLSLFSTVVDSLGVNKTQKPIQLALATFQDTTLKFTYRHQSGERNNQRIDIENHKPHTNNEAKTFNLFVNTEEPNLGEGGAFSTSQRIVFKKLSDQTTSNPDAFSSIPMIVDYNVSNLMDNVSFSTLNIRGNAQLTKTSQIMYNLQSSATSQNYGDIFQNTNYYLGYFHNRGNLQAGFINGGLMGLQSFGKGIKGGYVINDRVQVNAFYTTNTNRLGEHFLDARGGNVQVRFYKQNKILVEYGESENTANKTFTQVLNTRFGFNFLRTQMVNVSLSNSWNTFRSTNTSASGSFYMLNYAGNFFRNKLNVNHGYGSSGESYSNSDVSRTFYNHRTRYSFSERWSLNLVNNYSQTASRQYFNANVTAWTNQISVIRAFKFQSVQLGAIYNVFEYRTATNIVKGFSINHNTFKPKDYTRFSATIEGGFSSPKDTAGKVQSLPYLLFNSVLFYKTFSVNARYIMGTYGSTPVVTPNPGGITQQIFTSALQHQYLFKNTQFMLQSGLNYFYNNLFRQHTINLFPEIYYFSQSGWRFRVGVNYNLMSSVALRNLYSNQSLGEEAPRITNQGMFVSMGVRKEFTIDNPVKKQRYVNSEFLAFFDVNGNGVKDRNERTFENVVIRVNEDEVITNAEGSAKVLDASAGLAKITVLPLDEVQGWFANIPDSVLLMKDRVVAIPFVKGVKIKGRVSIKREQVAADANEPFDLSRIKITAAGSKTFNSLTSTDGTFEFYLPFGQYTISFDEKVLGEKYKITKNDLNILVSKDTDGMVISFHIVERTRKINKKVFTQPNSTAPQNTK